MSRAVGRAVSGTRRSYVRPSKARKPMLAQPRVVAAVVVLFVASMAHALRPEEVAEAAPQVEEAGAAFSLVFAAELIEAYRREKGALPQSLSEVGLSEAEYRYWPDRDGSFQLGAAGGGELVRFGHGENPADLLRMMTSSTEGET